MNKGYQHYKFYEYFRRFPTKSDHQLRIILFRWEGIGLRTWPPTYTGRQKRAIHFGFGYLSWRIK